MASQVTNGKAFEWAVGLALTSHGGVLLNDKTAKQNNKCFESSDIPSKKRETYIYNATAAINHIISKEKVDSFEFYFQLDQRGIYGDVRDIVIFDNGSEFGISCKTNHSAYKHSRLSGRADFVKKWNLDVNGCSDEYWKTISPVFEKLRKLREDSKGKALWRDQRDVPNDFYWPVLNAFEEEVKRVESPIMCTNFVQYLVGANDFYKVISRNSGVEILGFNLNKSLSVQHTKLPTRIDSIVSKNGSQFAKTISFNNGWSFNFRIHSASSRIEPSLKFDVTAFSLPPKLYRHNVDRE